MSRIFGIDGTADAERTPLQALGRFVESLRKYGLDTDEEDCFTLDYDGNVSLNGMILEQAKSILRAMWNHRVTVQRMYETVYEEDGPVEYVFYTREKSMDTVGTVEIALEEYLNGEMEFESDSDDESEEDESDCEVDDE